MVEQWGTSLDPVGHARTIDFHQQVVWQVGVHVGPVGVGNRAVRLFEIRFEEIEGRPIQLVPHCGAVAIRLVLIGEGGEGAGISSPRLLPRRSQYATDPWKVMSALQGARRQAEQSGERSWAPSRHPVEMRQITQRRIAAVPKKALVSAVASEHDLNLLACQLR